jgi:hypothetical protein
MADTFEGELDIIGFPKVTITALKNFPLSAGSETRKDGSIVFCVETNKLYRWDADSTETPDDDDVILSNLSGTGRWLAIGEFVKNLAHLGDNQTFTGNNTFATGLLSNGAITVIQDPYSIILYEGDVVTSNLVSGDITEGRIQLKSGGNGESGTLNIQNTTGGDILNLDTSLTGREQNIYHFGKNGNNSNDAETLLTRKLTADAAIAVANAHTPTPTGKNRVLVKCTDGASYNKFNLSGGPGFITMDAEEAGFNVLITSGSPDGIKIAPAYQADLGYIINDDASDQPGALLEFLSGASLQGANIRQIFNSGAINHTLIKSSGGKVFVNCDELRQNTDRTAPAIDVVDGFLRLERNKFLRGGISVAANKSADLNMLYTDSDIIVGDGASLIVNSFLDMWIGNIIIGDNCFVKIQGLTWNGQITSQGTGGLIILDFNQEI